MKEDLKELIHMHKVANRPGEDLDDTVEGAFLFKFDHETNVQVEASELRGWDTLFVRVVSRHKKHKGSITEAREPTFRELRDIRRRFFNDDERLVVFIGPEKELDGVHLHRPQDFVMPHPNGTGEIPGSVIEDIDEDNESDRKKRTLEKFFGTPLTEEETKDIA